MSTNKLTPLEVLQRKKARLQLKADTLMEELEDNLEYMQRNMGTIICNSAREAVVSKTPPAVQSLLGRDEDSEKSAFNRLAMLEGVLDILPFFIKGPKGWLAQLVLNQVKKWIFKRENGY